MEGNSITPHTRFPGVFSFITGRETRRSGGGPLPRKERAPGNHPGETVTTDICLFAFYLGHTFDVHREVLKGEKKTPTKAYVQLAGLVNLHCNPLSSDSANKTLVFTKDLNLYQDISDHDAYFC